MVNISVYIEHIKKTCNSEKIILMYLDGVGYHCPLLGEELVSINQSEEEQVKTVIHELIHGHPKHKDIDMKSDGIDEIEKEIEDATQEICNFYPEIREYVKKQLRIAKSSIFNYG